MAPTHRLSDFEQVLERSVSTPRVTALLLGAFGALALVLAAAYLGTRLMKKFLYEISPTDPISLGTACVLLLAIRAVASWLPARRRRSIR
jgi:hypothetical protein